MSVQATYQNIYGHFALKQKKKIHSANIIYCARCTAHLSDFPWSAIRKLCMQQLGLKSVNLQYNTLVFWAGVTNDSLTKHYFFFYKILQNSLQKPFQFIYQFFFIKLQRWKIKRFECPKSRRNSEKKILGMSDTWSTSCLSIGPANQRTVASLCTRMPSLYLFSS